MATKTRSSDRFKPILICFVLLLTAAGVRLLSWQDNRFDALKVEWGVTAEYKEAAQVLSHGEFSAYLHNLFYMTHPPGYSILLALISKTINNSDAAVQLFQIAADAVAVVIVFLIVSGLLAQRAGIIAGLLVAISPQLAYYPSLMLPDSISVLPILSAIYCLVLAYQRPRVLMVMLAGVLVGVSCWLRANALLLMPFLVAIIPLLFKQGARLRYAAALALGTILVLAPITIKNLVVYHQFIPLSLGSGQKLLQGIAQYDSGGEFGIPKTDAGIVRQEAEMFHRPDYLGGLFAGDGVRRDRQRVARGLSVIRAHPLWYLGVMTRRAASFLQLARVPSVATTPPNTYPVEIGNDMKPVWVLVPHEMPGAAAFSGGAKAYLAADGQSLSLIGDDSKNGDQLTSPLLAVNKNTDYLLRVPIDLQSGRMLAAVLTPERKDLHSTIVDTPEVIPRDGPVQRLKIPFATGDSLQVRLVISSAGAKPTARLGPIEMFEVGPTRFKWTRLPRILIHVLEAPFITACMLVLTLAGVGLLVRERKWQSLAILLIVPAYYLGVQSALHTERRYVIAIHYFLFALAALPITFLVDKLVEGILRGRKRRETALPMSHPNG